MSTPAVAAAATLSTGPLIAAPRDHGRGPAGPLHAACRAVLALSAFFGPSLGEGRLPHHLMVQASPTGHTLSGARDPDRFAEQLGPPLQPAPVPLTQQEAVAFELLTHGQNMARPVALATAQALCAEARQVHLDPLLALAVIGVESGYDYLAVSDRGAQGLMQLMPETASFLAARRGVAEDADLAFDPVVNVRLGVDYLAQLRRRFAGRLPAALTAYNRGPSATRAVLNTRGEVPRGIQAAYAGRVMVLYRGLLTLYGHLPRS